MRVWRKVPLLINCSWLEMGTGSCIRTADNLPELDLGWFSDEVLLELAIQEGPLISSYSDDIEGSYEHSECFSTGMNLSVMRIGGRSMGDTQNMKELFDAGMTTRNYIEETLADSNPDAILFEGLDDAIIGIANQHAGIKPVVAYSRSKIIECLERDGASNEEAEEWFDFNIGCLAVPPGTPVIVDDGME